MYTQEQNHYNGSQKREQGLREGAFQIKLYKTAIKKT